ncbi:MAG: hypothetical protein ABIR96_11590 [Bdellovibrionota bacterium]
MKNTLHTWSLLAVALFPLASNALDMGQARSFAIQALEVRASLHFAGEFRWGDAGSRDLFDSYDEAAKKLLGDKSRVLKVVGEEETVRLLVRDMATKQDLWVSTASSHYQENLTLTIETETSRRNSASGSFVSFSQASDAQSSKTLTAGLSTSNFSVAVFGKLVGQDWTLGAATNAWVEVSKGLKIGITAQVTQTSRNVLNVTEGHFVRRFDHYASPSMRIEIQKSWSMSGIRSGAGVQFDWIGGADFSATPAAHAFVSLGKDFVDSRGQTIAKLDFLATRQLGMSGEGWMASLMGSFYF